MGVIVRTVFNPQVQIGRRMKVTSSIPNACGIWNIIQVQHDLATMLDRGPWFTTSVLVWPHVKS